MPQKLHATNSDCDIGWDCIVYFQCEGCVSITCPIPVKVGDKVVYLQIVLRNQCVGFGWLYVGVERELIVELGRL